MFSKKLSVFLIISLVFSGLVFGQVYQKELESYDLPGLQKKLDLIDATLQTEPVVATFLANFSRFDDHSVTKALTFLDSLKKAKADLNLPIKGDPSGTPLVTAVRRRVEPVIVEWLIKNGARFGSNKRGVDSLIDDALLQGDYQTAKLLIALNDTLPVKQQISVMDGFGPTIAVLKDDVPAVKKMVVASGSNIDARVWKAAIAARSQKVCDFLMAVSDNHPGFISANGNMDSGMYTVVLGNPVFLAQLLAGGYEPGKVDDLTRLIESALDGEQFDSLVVLVSSDKAAAWKQGWSFWDKLARTNFDAFRSLTSNITEIVVPDASTAGDVSEYQKLFYGDASEFRVSGFGIIGLVLKQTGPDAVKALLKRVPPKQYTFYWLNARNPDLGAALLAIDDGGTLQTMLDDEAKKNAPKTNAQKEQ